MARPTKEGLDYFPVAVGMDQDDKLSVMIAKYGMLGLGLVLKIMMEIYKNGYFYAWGEREHFVFSNKINVDINITKEIVNECIKWSFFNETVYKKHGILTSKGVQERYIEASKRRKEITFVREYTLIDLKKACLKVFNPIYEVDVFGNEINVYINPDKAEKMRTESAQSKVNEIKSNEIKEIQEREIIESVTTDDLRDKLQKLIQECNIKPTILGLEQIFSYIGTVEIGVIELAVKKSEGNHINYAVTILEGWITEGKTTVAALAPKRGTKKQQSDDGHNRSGKPIMPIVSSTVGESTVTDEQFAEMVKLAERTQANKEK